MSIFLNINNIYKFFQRPLVRELTIVLIIKVIIIFFLKITFFNNPVAISWQAPDIDKVLLK